MNQKDIEEQLRLSNPTVTGILKFVVTVSPPGGLFCGCLTSCSHRRSVRTGTASKNAAC